MKKILISITLFYACNTEEITSYDGENMIKPDTLDVEQIKIETH